MAWKKIANLRGPAGYNATGAAEDDETIASYARAESGPTALNQALSELSGLNVRNFGAIGDGITDDSAAIQAAIDALIPGQTLIFPPLGSTNAFYNATNLVVTTPSVRFLGVPRDGYAVSIRSKVAGSTILTEKAGGFVMENVGIIGDADATGPSQGANGEGATITGLALMGTTNGDVDAAIRGCTFQFLALGIRLYGRNATISNDTIFSNCLDGVRHDGIDATHHTGPAADQNRGHVIRDCRFHNIGTSGTNAAINFTPNAKLLHAIIDGNHFDSNGLGRHIVVEGTSAAPARGLSIMNSKHTEVSADVIVLTQAQYPVLQNITMMGAVVTGGSGLVMTSCLYPMLDGFLFRGIGTDGIRGVSCSSVQIANGKILQVGAATGSGHAMNFDSTNSNVRIVGVTGHTISGQFFSGSPTGAGNAMIECYTDSATAAIASNTMFNSSHRGANAYIEGRSGRIEDTGYGQYDLAAATPKLIATASAGGTFGTFILEIELSGRDSVTGNLFFSGKRFVRPENGTPIITTLGTDASAGVTVTIAASGNSGVSVTVQAANANWIGARVRAVAGGAASGAVSRSVTVTMAAQP